MRVEQSEELSNWMNLYSERGVKVVLYMQVGGLVIESEGDASFSRVDVGEIAAILKRFAETGELKGAEAVKQEKKR